MPRLLGRVNRRTVHRLLTPLALWLSLCALPASPTAAFEGPLWNKNQFPLSIPVISPYLDQATPGNSWDLGFSYSSVFLLGTSPGWVVDADMEMTELTVRYRRLVGASIEVGVDIPVLAFTSGVLDGLLNGYHDAFGLPDYGRPSRSDNEFLYRVSRNGAPLIVGNNGAIGLGDVRLSVKKALLQDDPVLSLKAEIELPTGDGKKGFGNENVDVALSLLLDKKLGRQVKAYVNLGAALPGHYKGYQTVSLKGFLFGGAAVEWAPWQCLSLVGQASFQQSPWRKTGIPDVDDIGVLLTLGGRYRWGQSSVEVGFTEDLNAAGAPDFTLSLSYRKRF